MAGAQPVARARRDCGPGRGACEGAHTHPRPPGCGPRRHARRQGFPAVAGASRGLDPADLSRPHDPRRPRLQRARGEPHQRHPARACVRRARPLLDLPHPHPWRRRGLPAPSAAEQAVLERVHAGPEVRLACQLRPTSDLAFVPLLSPYATTLDAYQAGAANSGVERYLVIMFVDMRGSSRLAEMRLPFDTVFIINQFLNAVSHAVLDAGGQPNQVLGDGLLALFGMSDPARRRLPAGDLSQRRDRRPGREAEHRAGSCAGRADPLRRRHPRRRNRRRRHRLRAPRAIHGDRRSGQCRRASPGPDQGDGVRSVDVGRGLRARRLRSGRPPRPRGRDARTRGERESPQRRAGGGSGRPDRGVGAGGMSGWNRRAVPRTPRPARAIRRFGDPAQFNGKKL